MRINNKNFIKNIKILYISNMLALNHGIIQFLHQNSQNYTV